MLVAGLTVDIFDGGEPEPSFRAAEARLTEARAFAPDGLLGLAAGSNMDLAKITKPLFCRMAVNHAPTLATAKFPVRFYHWIQKRPRRYRLRK